MIDQATKLRRLIEHPGTAGVACDQVRSRLSFGPDCREGVDDAQGAAAPMLAHAIAVTSGKGGVGKSNLAVNLAVQMVRMGRRVCLIDADLGLANVDVLCNLTARVTLDHVVHGSVALRDAMIPAPGGFGLIPGASGVSRMADLKHSRRAALFEGLAELERSVDVILIDTGAGLSANVLAFCAAAHMVLLTTTPEPTAVTDGYGMVKAIFARAPAARIGIAVNMAANDREGRSVHRRIDRVSRSFLGRSLAFAGTIPDDGRVREAVRERIPFAVRFPRCPASKSLRRVADEVLLQRDCGTVPTANQGGFIAKLSRWVGKKT